MLARLIVLIAMLLLAFAGVVFTDVNQSGAFHYWQWIAVIYAVMALALSWYERRDPSVLRPTTLIHELFHWIGANAAVYLVSLFVSLGIISRFEAALLILTVLSLAVYLAGIYIEISFVIIGIVLGLFAVIVAFTVEYLYAIAFPILFIASAVLFWYLFHHKNRKID